MISSILFYRASRRFLPDHTELGRVKDAFLKLGLYHSSSGGEEVLPPFEWYEKAFPKLRKLTQQLRSVDFVDGIAVCIDNDVDDDDDSFIMNARVVQKITTMKQLARIFIGSPLVQQKIKQNMVGDVNSSRPIPYFRKAFERVPMIVDSLTKVSNFLKVSAQQRKVVRVTIAPQVTHHRIWTGALQEVLNGLKLEMDGLGYDRSSSMGPQIVASCSKFLADSNTCFEDDSSSSWMRLAPAGTKHTDSTTTPRTWEDVLDMFDDLIKCLRFEKESSHSLCHLSKLETMKEGLAQIKDVLIDKGLGYREARLQEGLVQKKLSGTLGHSSPCLFTLLLYYLYGQVRDIEVDLSGGIYQIDDKKGYYCLRMGRILSSDEEQMVMRGVKHLDKVLGLFKFVWETAGMDGVLELQGHLFCVDAEDRRISYRGNEFFLHGICF
ncbi:hypothetical protein LINPERHAP1_LOCUS32179 [Linum perenne]